METKNQPHGAVQLDLPHVQKMSLEILDASRLAPPEPAQILRVGRFFMKDVFSVKIYQHIPKIKKKVPKKITNNLQTTASFPSFALVLPAQFVAILLEPLGIGRKI